MLEGSLGGVGEERCGWAGVAEKQRSGGDGSDGWRREGKKEKEEREEDGSWRG
jgi:hypothetical protein